MKNWTRRGIILSAGTLALSACANGTSTAKRNKIDINVESTLNEMHHSLPFTRDLEKRAAGILVIPNLIKGGLIYGGTYGEGSMLVKNAPVDYYSVAGASFGLQIGLEKLSTVLFFMNSRSLREFRAKSGWTIGLDLELTLLTEGQNAAIDSNTYQDEVYAVAFGHKGLLAGISLEGTKYTRIIR